MHADPDAVETPQAATAPPQTEPVQPSTIQQPEIEPSENRMPGTAGAALEPVPSIPQHAVTDNLEQLLGVLPPPLRDRLQQHNHLDDLLEIVMDLGRLPEARFPGEHVRLGDQPVSHEDLQYVVQRVGEFGQDNRAGLERTLHRISAIRNRTSRVVGLTCRIGRAVYGTIDIIRDIVESGQSILLLGRPGIGKTTKLREVARVLSTEFGKRVIVVDTSNEIAGDGDIPHPAIGDARRMQVATPEFQHAVMIEAVENHMPEVIVIDEIGTEAEANAARTIAERGVQLVGTAHGNSLENLMMNPTLSDLIGGIQAVTLGDEEARRRGTQKTVLERKAPPTFDCIIELMDVDRLAIHRDVATVVDRILRGESARPEMRVREADGQIRTVQPTIPPPRDRGSGQMLRRRSHSGMVIADRTLQQTAPEIHPTDRWGAESHLRPDRDLLLSPDRLPTDRGRGEFAAGDRPAENRVVDSRVVDGREVESRFPEGEAPAEPSAAAAPPPRVRGNRHGTVYIFPYGVSRSRLERAILELGVPAVLTKDPRESHVVLTLKSHFRNEPGALKGVDGLPVFVVKSNTYVQISGALRDIFGLGNQDAEELALREVETAVEQVLSDNRPVELAPQSAYIRRLQHQLVEKYRLLSESIGAEPNRRLRVYKG